MWHIASPTVPVSRVIDLCVSRMTNTDLKLRISITRPVIEDAANSYSLALQSNTLFALAQPGELGELSIAEHKALYESQFAVAGRPARTIYDYIKMSAPYGRCPLCGRGAVYTLDHHLAKALYPNLAVVPLNLVPSCQDCNKNKATSQPHSASEETLHPYSDNIDDEIWLKADIIESAPVGITYRVDAPTHWTGVMRQRVENHMRVFKLKSLFASYGAQEIANICGLLSKQIAVKAFLSEAAESHRHFRRNTWQAAAYEGMAASEWFCDGGFSRMS